MAQTVSNVSAAKPVIAGAVHRAPLNTTLPTDAKTALSSAFIAQGYVSTDGLTNGNAFNSEAIYAWGGDAVLMTENEHADTFVFTLLETLNKSVAESIYGSGNVSEASGKITIRKTAAEHEESVWVFDMKIRGGKLKRIVVPDAKITALGDIAYQDNAVTGYPVTLSAMPDNSGNFHYEYIESETATTSN